MMVVNQRQLKDIELGRAGISSTPHHSCVHMATVHPRCKVTVCLVSLCPGWSQFANSTNYISNKFGSAQLRYLITNTTTREIRRALCFLWDIISLHRGNLWGNRKYEMIIGKMLINFNVRIFVYYHIKPP